MTESSTEEASMALILLSLHKADDYKSVASAAIVHAFRRSQPMNAEEPFARIVF
jgi:hypothetical protein